MPKDLNRCDPARTREFVTYTKASWERDLVVVAVPLRATGALFMGGEHALSAGTVYVGVGE